MKKIVSSILIVLAAPTVFAASEGPFKGPMPLDDAKVLIEHNASDEDTGFQFFVDGEPWKDLRITGPNGTILKVNAEGNLADFGLTEGFFETNEPENDEVPIPEVLSLLPEGQYLFKARSAEDGAAMTRFATLTHAIPAKPQILTPAEGETVPGPTVLISWNPVTQTIYGMPVNIVGYQVIVEAESEEPVQSFFRNEFNVFLPASQTSITVPAEFLEEGTEYEIEVLAIEESGNQTIGIREFETAE